MEPLPKIHPDHRPEIPPQKPTRREINECLNFLDDLFMGRPLSEARRKRNSLTDGNHGIVIEIVALFRTHTLIARAAKCAGTSLLLLALAQSGGAVALALQERYSLGIAISLGSVLLFLAGAGCFWWIHRKNERILDRMGTMKRLLCRTFERNGERLYGKNERSGINLSRERCRVLWGLLRDFLEAGRQFRSTPALLLEHHREEAETILGFRWEPVRIPVWRKFLAPFLSQRDYVRSRPHNSHEILPHRAGHTGNGRAGIPAPDWAEVNRKHLEEEKLPEPAIIPETPK